MASQHRRAINTPGSDVGRARRELYASAHERIKDAMAAGYMLEAITLCESLLADRLESRIAFLHQQAESKRSFSTLGKLTTELLGARLGESVEACDLYQDVADWAASRNEAVHQMVKLRHDQIDTWAQRYDRAHSTARRGLTLANRAKRLVQRLNTVESGK